MYVRTSFLALSGRLKCTVRRHKLNTDSLSYEEGLGPDGTPLECPRGGCDTCVYACMFEQGFKPILVKNPFHTECMYEQGFGRYNLFNACEASAVQHHTLASYERGTPVDAR